jgi:alkanesulfonate monooxygenase SsuD/methylene tetrahydromethanopterin reductase-like flavin-dependent oxidoreductase (luciferase family)
MEFGMFFEMQLPRPWADGDEQQLFSNALEQAELGEQCGVSYAWAQEHHFLEEYSHSTAPEVLLAALSQRTTTMRMGHAVTLMPPAFNHPVRVAERIATLDLVSGGRVEWGTGESSSRLELEGFGVNYVEKRAMWAEAARETARMMSTTPYPGYEGRYFSMPPRNIVPKPVQRPHPPMWIACTNRDTLKLAARLGVGALTFAFMDASEAKYWVEEYHQIFERECQPIGQAVNPRVAMLGGLMVDADGDLALARGLEGQQFFKWALAWYYRFGSHVPGRTRLWDEFKASTLEPMAGIGGVGSPEQVRQHFRELEDAGVDQVILLHQAGDYRHDDICDSLELFGRSVVPEFVERHQKAAVERDRRLEPAIEKALTRVVPAPDIDPPVVDAYPLQLADQGVDAGRLGTKRAVDASLLWRMHVAGAAEKEEPVDH